MSQSRFSIVLVGVSALLRRPLVSRLRPADGERSSWVVFAARGGRFDSALPSPGWPSGSLLPLFGTHRFGVAAGRVGSSAFRFGVALGGLAFGFTASAFRHAPFRSGCWASSFFRLPLRRLPSASSFFRWTVWPSGSPLPLFGMRRFGVAAGRVRSSAGRVGLRAHCFRFSARTASEITLGGLAFGLPLRSGPRRVGLRAHCFRFSACTDSEWPLGEFVLPPSVSEIAARWLALPPSASGFCLPLRRFRSAGWPSDSRLPLFGTRRFGVAAGRVRSSAFRFGDSAGRVGLRASASEIALGGLVLPLGGWPSGSLLPLFGTHRFAPPHR